MTDEELKALIASLAILHKESHIEFRNELQESRIEFDIRSKENQAESARLREETDKRFKETDKQIKETDKQIKELGRQIGGLSNKFGSFTEGLALPSMIKILREQFGMNIIAPRVWARRNGSSLELDVLAYSNGEKKTVYIVEVKSHLREEGLEQIMNTLSHFLEFFPEHKDKALYGILAAVSIPDNTKIKVLESGIYLATIQDEHFRLQVPKDFKARNFN
jgi:hypothetical protein